MANKPQIGLSQSPLALLQKLGIATGGQQSGGASDVERMLSQLSGPRYTNSLAPVANPELIGSGNANLSNTMNNAYQNIFGYVGQDAANSLAWAQQAQARREAAEAQAKQAALQAKLLAAQKKAALAGLGGGGTSNTGGAGPINTNTGGGYSLPWDNKPANNNLKLPMAGDNKKPTSPYDNGGMVIVAPPKPKTNSPIAWAAYQAALAASQAAAKIASNAKNKKKPPAKSKPTNVMKPTRVPAPKKKK